MATKWVDWIYEIQELSVEEIDELFMKRVHTEKNYDFEYIDNWSDFMLIRRYRKALKEIIKSYKEHWTNLYNEYCTLIPTYDNTDDKLTILLTVKACEACVDYYTHDIQTLTDMVDEYKYYLTSGHIIEQLFNNDYRPKELFWDHRYVKPEENEDE